MIVYYQGEPIAYFDDSDKGWGWLVDWCYNLIKKGFSHNEIVGDLEILEKLDKYNFEEV